MRFEKAGLIVILAAAPAWAALRVVETVPLADLDVPAAGTVRVVDFTTAEPITGVGLSALWTAVVADSQNGTAPWSVDLGVTVTAPGGEMLDWPFVGGEVSIANYPLQDATGTFVGPTSAGSYTWAFSSVQGVWVAGLRNVEAHAMTTVPDVTEIINGSTAMGPQWNRPFSIVGISSQGPVAYETLEFTVPVSGLYTFESVRADGTDNFTFLYEGGFEPTAPLADLLDYGLGNGFAVNNTPRGTSLIESLLIAGRSYTLVNSQWASFRPGGDYAMTITGPAAVTVAGACPFDFDQSGVVGGADLAALLAAWGQPGPTDLNADGVTNGADLALLLAAWGPCV